MIPIFFKSQSIKSIPQSNYNLKSPHIQSADSELLNDILYDFFLRSAGGFNDSHNIDDSHNLQKMVILNTTRNNKPRTNKTMKKCQH